ncbi:MAG TPA: alpha/beta fold hydrolase, partial [Chloroflexota bacterium]
TKAVLEEAVDDAFLADMREMHQDPNYPSAYVATVRSLMTARSLLKQRHLVRALAAAKLPVLLVWGVEDKLFPVEHATRTHGELPNSNLVLIEGAGHSPQWERPEEFNRVIAEFLG